MKNATQISAQQLVHHCDLATGKDNEKIRPKHKSLARSNAAEKKISTRFVIPGCRRTPRCLAAHFSRQKKQVTEREKQILEMSSERRENPFYTVPKDFLIVIVL